MSVSRDHVRVALTAMLCVGLAAVGALLIAGERHAASHDYLSTQLGPRATHTSLVRHPTHNVTVAIDKHGYTVHAQVGRATSVVSLASTAVAAAGSWRGYRNGAIRSTSFGSEAITALPGKTEELLVVDHRQGKRTWRWSLDGTLTPKRGPGGSILLVGKDGSMVSSILPVEILTQSGKNVTPAGLHWSLARHAGTHILELRLDDAHLPSPYTIDPTVTWAVAANGNAHTQTSVTFNITPSAANQLLLVGYNAENLTTSACQATGVTYEGFAMTLVPGSQVVATAVSPNYDCTALYYMLNPATTGTHAVVITFGASQDGIVGGAETFSNVWQNAAAVSTATTSQAAGLTSTAFTTTWPNQMLVDGIAPGDTIATMGTWNAGAGQTYEVHADSTASGGSDSLGMSFDLMVAPGAHTMSWTSTTAPNRSAQAVTALESVDGTGPALNSVTLSGLTGQTFANGSTLYYNAQGANSGTFTVNSSFTDADSGVSTVAYPAVATMAGGSGTATNGSPSTSAYASSSPTAYSWTSATTATGAQTVTATNRQGGTGTGTFTLVNDTTAPTGAITAPAASANVRGAAVTVSSNSADGSSGVASAQFQRSPAGAGIWTNIGAADTTNPYSVSWDSTAVADGLYDLRVITTDNVGNTFTSPTITNVRVDNTLPTNALSLSSVTGGAYLSGTTVYYRGAALGNFQLTNTVADAGSGPASSIFPALGGTTTNWSHTTQTVNTPAGGPYVTTNNFAWTAGAVSAPTESVTSTDNAGNTSTATTLTFTNDSTAPTGAITAPAASANVSGAAVTVSSNSADAGSGVASAQFQRSPAGAGIWTNIGAADTTNPYSVSWDSTAVADGLYDLRVITTDNVGNTFTSALVTNVRVDNTLPTGSITAPAASANVRGAAVTVSSNSADGGSGVASAQFQRSPAGAGIWTNIGAADTTNPYSVSWDSTAVADGLYDLRVITTDNVGNTFTSALVTNVRVDNTLPTNVLSLSSVTGGAYLSGTTVYYRGAALGNFQLTNTVTDAGSGPASSIFPILGGTVGGWTHTTQTVNTPAGGPYVTTNNFAWPAAETNSPTEAATSTDNAGNTSAATTLTFTNDSTLPTGSMTAPAASAIVRGAAVTVSSTAADGGSGVASAQFQYSTAGSGGPWTNIGAADTTNPYQVSWDTTAVADGLYDLRVVTTDNVGNSANSTTVTNVRVDNTLPTNALTLSSVTGGAYLSGTTVYYRGAALGNFQLKNTVADAGSGPASSIFPALGGTVGGWTHTTQTVNTPAGGPYVTTNNFAWPAAESASPTEAVTSTDNAGNTSTVTTLTFTNDSTAPTGGALTVNGTAASGVGTSSYSTSGNFTIGTRTDYNADTGSGFASSTLTVASATLTANSCGSYGAPSVIVGSPAQTQTTGCYLYTLTGLDHVGNSATITTSRHGRHHRPHRTDLQLRQHQRRHLLPGRRQHRLLPPRRSRRQLRHHRQLHRRRQRRRLLHLPHRRRDGLTLEHLRHRRDPHLFLHKRRSHPRQPARHRHQQRRRHRQRRQLDHPVRLHRTHRRRPDRQRHRRQRSRHQQLLHQRQLHHRHPHRLQRRHRLRLRQLHPHRRLRHPHRQQLRQLRRTLRHRRQPRPNPNHRLLPLHPHRPRPRRQQRHHHHQPSWSTPPPPPHRPFSFADTSGGTYYPGAGTPSTSGPPQPPAASQSPPAPPTPTAASPPTPSPPPARWAPLWQHLRHRRDPHLFLHKRRSHPPAASPSPPPTTPAAPAAQATSPPSPTPPHPPAAPSPSTAPPPPAAAPAATSPAARLSPSTPAPTTPRRRHRLRPRQLDAHRSQSATLTAQQLRQLRRTRRRSPAPPRRPSPPATATCSPSPAPTTSATAATLTTTVKVDTTAPSAPTGFTFSGVHATATTRARARSSTSRAASAGGFTATASGSADADTGIAGYNYGAIAGTGWANAAGAYTFTAASPTGTGAVTATNNAGLTGSSASFTATADSTAPAGGAFNANGIAATGGG